MANTNELDKILHEFAGCGFPHPQYMTCEWCDSLPEVKARIIATVAAEAVEERTKLINEKFKRLEAGMIAVAGYLDKPYTDDPRWSPWSRFVLPRMKMVREAIKGNDIGEMAAMAALPNQTKEKQ